MNCIQFTLPPVNLTRMAKGIVTVFRNPVEGIRKPTEDGDFIAFSKSIFESETCLSEAERNVWPGISLNGDKSARSAEMLISLTFLFWVAAISSSAGATAIWLILGVCAIGAPGVRLA